MKKIITSDITAVAKMPFKKGTLDHLQESYTELILDAVQSLVGSDYDTNKPYAIFRCQNNATPPNYTIVSGMILWNSVLYKTTGTPFTVGGGDTAVGTITTSYLTAVTADPVEFTDGNNHNVHEIKQITFAAGAPGSGDFDYADVVFVKLEAPIDVTYAANWDAGAGSPATYRRNRDGLVTIAGSAVANGGGATVNQTMFILPLGYRPAVDVFATALYFDSTNLWPCWIQITVTGLVRSFNTNAASYSNDDAIIMQISFYNN